MIDILNQHAREWRLTVILFVAVVFIFVAVQWGIRTASEDAAPQLQVETK